MGNYECFKSMKTMLDGVGSRYVERYSITLVPEQLRKSEVEACNYRPQVVSIGPLHKETRTDLLYMEDIKWSCTLHLLQRSEINAEDALEKCTSAMLDLDELVRASYNVDKLRFNCNDLAKIMIVDGCFLLELLICGSPDLNTELQSKLPGPGPIRSPGAEVIKRDKVLSDLTLLENQIPLGVLACLSNVLFPPPQLKDKGDRFELICKLALSIMGYDYTTYVGGFHFVELVHSFVHMEKDALEKEIKKENENIDVMIDINGKENFRIDPKKRLQPCAAKLKAAGVTIQSKGAEPAGVTIQSTVAEPAGVTIQSKGAEPAGVTIQSTVAEPKSARFDLKVAFQDGKLTIPPLHITETTEAKWRNLIAWELNKSSMGKQLGVHEREFSALFISYAWFFQSLICCAHDVKLLRKRGVIIVQHKGNMSDEDLMCLFQNLTSGVPAGEIDMDSWFAYVIQKLNSYRPPKRTCKYHATRTSKTIWHILNWFVMWIWYKCRGKIRVLIRDYIPTGWKLIAVLAATAGLLLTGLQTYYAIHPTK